VTCCINVLQVKLSGIFDLEPHFQDGGYDVISCIKVLVLPPGECTRNVYPARMQQRLPFLIRS